MPNQSGLTIGDMVDVTNYANQESSKGPADTAAIEGYKEQLSTVKDKNQAIADLRQIKELIVQNKTLLEDMDSNATKASSILKKEIDELTQTTLINNLINNNIDQGILSICIAEYNKANAELQELRYRQNILSYKAVFIKGQKEDLDFEIEQIDRYIIALNESTTS
jgi:hypothetical protein